MKSYRDRAERLNSNKGFPGGSDGKEPACSAEDLGSIPRLGRSLRRQWQPTPGFPPGEFHR